ncbi:MAG: NUDIX hydrolase [Planctomycetaceae bacterium]|nr:NUDIX hydrolase [Planctomycetales bacterium]MCB9924237.1 NUDIX hydrolase [Planctomycetaceae bacterium]
MRQSIGAMAVIRYEQADQTCWLTQWNKRWHGFHLVGGHKLPDESYYDCVVREICEELGLEVDRDFVVSEVPLSQVSYVAQSRSAGVETLYSVEVFDTKLLAGAKPKVDANRNNRWVTDSEVRQQCCDDGMSISPTMRLLLEQSGLLARS